jgi:probable DNA repair protein
LRALGAPEVYLRTVLFESRRTNSEDLPAPWNSAVLAARLDTLSKQIRDLPRRADTAGWAKTFTAWLSMAGWPDGRPLDSAEFQAVEAWNRLLSCFSGLTDFAGSLGRGEALALLQRLAGETVFQPRTADAAVQVLGLYQANGQAFDHLWVMGLHDAAWPPAPAPDPFIPLGLQRDRGLPHCEPEAERAWAARVTEQLGAAAPEVVFSYPCRDGDQELACSPLIADLQPADPEVASAGLHDAWAARIRRSTTLETMPARDPLPLRRSQVAGGYRVFAHQAACPFRAFAEHRLAARPLDRLRVGLGPVGSGTLMHRAMELLWRELQTHQALLAMDDLELRELVRRCCTKALEKQRARNPAALAERYGQIEADRLLEKILRWLEVERRRSPFRVVGLEDQVEFTAGGFQVSLKLDRIDELEDQSRVVIDYKTGAVRPSAWFGERPDDPQLPLYGVLANDSAAGPVAAVAFAQIRPEVVGFSGVVREEGVLPDLPGNRNSALREAADSWPQVLEDWSGLLTGLAAGFAAGTAEVDPKNGLQTCQGTFCELAGLCRIHEQGANHAAGDGPGVDARDD